MEQNYLCTEVLGNTLQVVIDEDKTTIVPMEVVTELAKYSGDIEEATHLVAYMESRVEEFNRDLENDKTGNVSTVTKEKFSCTPAFLKQVYKSLFEYGFTADQIEIALDQLKGYQLFGSETGHKYKYESKEEYMEARIAYIVNNVKMILNYPPINYRAEEESYRGV